VKAIANVYYLRTLPNEWAYYIDENLVRHIAIVKRKIEGVANFGRSAENL
jgi:hypothetical protein